MKRRHILTCGGAALLLAGCASTQAPTRWYELKSEPPEAVPAPQPGELNVFSQLSQQTLPGRV